jgi:hypothetical protein
MSTLPKQAVTKQYDFFQCNGRGEPLFSVRAGIPLTDAFDVLSSLLSSSIAGIELVASEESDNTSGASWQSAHLLNTCYALIQGMHQGHLDHLKTTNSGKG